MATTTRRSGEPRQPSLTIRLPTGGAMNAAQGGAYEDHINISLITNLEQVSFTGVSRLVHETYIHFAASNVAAYRIIDAPSGRLIHECVMDGEAAWAHISAQRGSSLDSRRSNRARRRIIP